MSKVLVVAAHADDEILGCGGTMARHADHGDSVAVMFLTDGVGSRSEELSAEATAAAKERSAASARALDIVGASLLAQLQLPDNAIDSVPRLEVTRQVEGIISDYQPDLIYTHHGGDLNIDHRRALESVLTACRPQGGPGPRAIYSFEVASSTAWQGQSLSPLFCPNHYVNISDQLDRKLQAMEAYAEEMRPFPHARSIEALEHQSKWRGSQVGFQAAEAFVLERSLVL